MNKFPDFNYINFIISWKDFALLLIKSSFSKLKIFFKKFLIAIEIIFHILFYFIKIFFYKFWFALSDSIGVAEFKSFLFVILFSFFFYYFIVIELSICLFGYSLLCYWFLFIFIMTLVIISWWLEAEFIKEKMEEEFPGQVYIWLEVYNGKNFLSLYDFFTGYKNRKLFKFLFLDKYREELDDGHLILSTLAYTLIFFFLYTCVYKFDPWFINLVVKYFHPVVNFFQSRRNPWLEDFMSAPVRFWNRFFVHYDYVNKTHTKFYDFIKEVTTPTAKIEIWANAQRTYKISLRKRNNFGDIFYLRALSLQPHLWKLVFMPEQPQIFATRFDPNWKLFFLRYLTNQFNQKKENFWTWYFYNDTKFWDLVKWFKTELNTELSWTDSQVIKNFQRYENFIPTTYELLVAQNYFDSNMVDTQPLFQTLGTNLDYFDNLVNHSKVNKVLSDLSLKEFFTVAPIYSPNHSISGLLSYWEQYSKKNKNFDNKNFKNLTDYYNIDYSNLSLADVKSILSFNLDIPLYTFNSIENFENLPVATLKAVFGWSISMEQLEKIYYRYNYRLNAVEDLLGLSVMDLKKIPEEGFNLPYMINLITKRINRIQNLVYSESFFSYFKNELPTNEDIKFYFLKALSNIFPQLEKKTLKDTFFPEEENKTNNILNTLRKKKFVTFKNSDIDSIIKMETTLWNVEKFIGLRSQELIAEPTQSQALLSTNSNYPWYILTLKYFSNNNYSFVMPGFIRFYFPTPHSYTFTTFGNYWNKYQAFIARRHSIAVGYSDSIAQMKNSTPLVTYSGVEAILYFKPLLEIFEVGIKHFIKLIGSFIEIIITQEIFTPLTSLTSLAVFAHILWFINFYIYIFIIFYMIYYFIIYYIRKVGFLWFYEWMYMEKFLTSYNNKTYWHNLGEIWYNYKSPDNMVVLALHTNILLYNSFFNYNNFFFYSLNRTKPLTSSIISSLPFLDLFSDFSFFCKKFQINENFLQKNEFYIFWSFFTVWVKKFQFLLFEGGNDLSYDHLIWNYFEYLNQFSLFVTRGLWHNYYKITSLDEITVLIKQLTILMSSQSLLKNLMILNCPLQDSNLSWKILINFFTSLLKVFSNNPENNYKFFLTKKTDLLAINYGLFINYWFEFHNFITSGGLDIYNLLNTKDFLFLTKFNSTSFWDDNWYWIFAFLRSIWFLPKIWYPNLDIHLSYEDTWLHLARVAYANSWIAQSTYVRPYYNLVQHIWWTSKVYSSSNKILSYNTGLNVSGVEVIDNVWNFLEKWYNSKNNYKIETIFGLVTTLDLPADYLNYSNDSGLPYVNKNFDLSFPDNLIDKKTTYRGYNKTNPPINLYELGITPRFLLKLFKNLPISLIRLYLTFISQLETLDKNLEYQSRTFDLKDSLFVSNDNFINYNYYNKEYDYIFNYNIEKVLNNYIFSIDISYFLNHFLTWDFFSTSLSEKRPTSFNPSKFVMESEINNIFLSNQDLLIKHNPYNSFLEKPLGMLDSYELHTMQKYKMIKLLDENSFSRNRDDPFLNLDLEHTVSDIGYSSYPKEDKKTLLEAYSEPYSGFRDKWYPYNPTILRNSVTPFLIGWVGEIAENTLDTTSFLYSLLYSSSKIDVNAWNQVNDLQQLSLKFGVNKYHTINSFFGKSYYQMQLASRSFTWLNTLTSCFSYRYSFGPKSSARVDYWSWKTGFTFDYVNGLYSYWPYLGFRHSFASRLTPYDPLYGFYKTYWQSMDNPLIMDSSIGALQHLLPKDDYDIGGDIVRAFSDDIDQDSYYTSDNIEKYSIPYREIYFTFHHPYFIGYIYFWLLVTSSEDFYLGIVNFSFKWLILKNFLIKNSIDDINFSQITRRRGLTENKYRRQMFKYWLYFANPSNLTTILDCILDDEIIKPVDNMHTLQNFFLMNLKIFNYFHNFLNFSLVEINFLLDFKKIINFSYQTNWLCLDAPFSINPFLILTNFNTYLDEKMLVKFFKLQNFSLSHKVSLQEPFNFNLFYDWSNGAYLDLFNFTSYISTVWGSSSLPSIFFDNPTYIAANIIKFSSDESENLAEEFRYNQMLFINSDILISYDLALNNIALLEFFRTSIDFMSNFNTQFYERNVTFSFINFYLAGSFFDGLKKFKTTKSVNADSKLHNYINSKFFKPWQLYFLYKLQSNLTHYNLLILLNTGLMFSYNRLNQIVLSFWLRLTNRYFFIHNFYWKIGTYITYLFFK